MKSGTQRVWPGNWVASWAVPRDRRTRSSVGAKGKGVGGSPEDDQREEMGLRSSGKVGEPTR